MAPTKTTVRNAVGNVGRMADNAASERLAIYVVPMNIIGLIIRRPYVEKTIVGRMEQHAVDLVVVNNVVILRLLGKVPNAVGSVGQMDEYVTTNQHAVYVVNCLIFGQS